MTPIASLFKPRVLSYLATTARGSPLFSTRPPAFHSTQFRFMSSSQKPAQTAENSSPTSESKKNLENPVMEKKKKEIGWITDPETFFYKDLTPSVLPSHSDKPKVPFKKKLTSLGQFNYSELICSIAKQRISELRGGKVKRIQGYAERHQRKELFLYRLFYKIKEEALNFKKGASWLKDDMAFVVDDRKEWLKNKYYISTYSKEVKVSYAIMDFIRFIPFLIFVLVPGLELFMPAWFLVFPNSIPSQFQSSKSKEDAIQRKMKIRHVAAENFIFLLKTLFARLEENMALSQEHRSEFGELRTCLENNMRPADILRHKAIFEYFVPFRHMDVKMLETISQFLAIDPVTGMGAVNRILGVIGIGPVPVDSPILKYWNKAILWRSLEYYFGKIRKRDKLVAYGGVASLSREEIQEFCFLRGIEVEGKDQDRIIDDVRIWLTLSNMSNIPHSLLLFIRVNAYLADELPSIRVDPDSLILRVFYIIQLQRDSDVEIPESLDHYEKTLGVDQIERILMALGMDPKVILYIPLAQRSPSASQPIQARGLGRKAS